MNELNKSANKTASYTIPSFYNHYLSNIEPDTVYDINYTTYRKIVTDYFCHLRDQLLEESKEVKLPYRMGSIQIVKKQPKHLVALQSILRLLPSKCLGCFFTI